MAAVHLTGPRVAVAAKPAALGGLRLLTPSIAVPSGRRARGLVVRAATVVAPKVTNNALGCYWPVCCAADPSCPCAMHFMGCVWFCGAGSAQKSQNLIEGFCVFRRLLGRLNFLLGGVRLYWLVVVHQGMRTF